MSIQGEIALGQLHLGFGKNLEQIAFIPTSPQAFGFDTNRERRFLLEKVESEMMKDGQVLGSMVFARTIGILTEGDVQNPMKAIFNLPVRTNRGEEAELLEVADWR